MSAADPTYVRSRDLLEAELGDELVALDAEDGLCFGFNDVATSIWRRLEQPTRLNALIDDLRKDYEVSREDCASDIRDVLNLLVEHKLLKRSW
jgi:hypothetical protein